jgi:hypothetical protein
MEGFRRGGEGFRRGGEGFRHGGEGFRHGGEGLSDAAEACRTGRDVTFSGTLAFRTAAEPSRAVTEAISYETEARNSGT